MTFPSNVPDGYEYTNPDNGKIYRWDDPPGAWTFIGTDDGGGGSGGGTPNPPGDGLVEGTDLRFQWQPTVSTSRTVFTGTDKYIKLDFSKCPSINDPANARFAYSYDAFTWYEGTQTGGQVADTLGRFAEGLDSNGDRMFVWKPQTKTDSIWRSSDGIDWEKINATGIDNSTSNPSRNFVIPMISQGCILLFNSSGGSWSNMYRSTDNGSTFTSVNVGIIPGLRQTYGDDDLIVTATSSTSGGNFRISIDGGGNWSTITGIPTSELSSFYCGWFRLHSDPQTIVFQSATGDKNAYYARVSDLLSGNYAFTQMAQGAWISDRNTLIHSFTVEDSSYVLLGSTSNLITLNKFNSTNTSVEQRRTTGTLPNIPNGTSSTTFSMDHTEQSLAHADRLLGVAGNQNGNVITGVAPNLYYNGMTIGYSSIIQQPI